jgi:hypothetical protein
MGLLLVLAPGEVLALDDRKALATFAAVLDTQVSRTRFDRGDFVPIDDTASDRARAYCRRRVGFRKRCRTAHCFTPDH